MRCATYVYQRLSLHRRSACRATPAGDEAGLLTPQVFVMAYPSFNVNEVIAIAELYEGSARDTGRPIIVFNGELDRIRSGYYPRLVYRKLAKLADDFIPLFESTFYVHNFKGARSGALFRVYPGPWQVGCLGVVNALLLGCSGRLQKVHTVQWFKRAAAVRSHVLTAFR